MIKRKSLVTPILTGVLIAVIPAILGYVASYVDGIRRDELDFRNKQIEKLYGPLYTLTQADNAAWAYFQALNAKSPYNFNSETIQPTPAQIAQWRIWMKNVFQPLNLQIEKVIIDNTQLVIGDRMPVSFQQLISHSEAYKAIIADWTESDARDPQTYTSTSKNTVVGEVYPEQIVDCAQNAYLALKKRQSDLETTFSVIGLRRSELQAPPSCEASVASTAQAGR